MDWKQLWEILSAPDNVPIIAHDSAARFLYLSCLAAGARE